MKIIKIVLIVTLLLGNDFANAQGPFPPAADSVGTTAVHMDSNIIMSWVNQVTVTRGLQNITNTGGPLANVGNETLATGKADGSVVSLGDGGIATISVDISDHDGYDFAIFENGFYDFGNLGYFLELAFVEVSSDGQNYYRFPCNSLTNTDIQTGSFGITDPTDIDGFAGKYRMTYGTPFDLSIMDTVIGLDIHNITQIRIVDVIGSIDSTYATMDSYGRKVNDPYPTEFGSGGFDLDAIALIDSSLVNVMEAFSANSISVFPNPVSNQLHIIGLELFTDYEVVISDLEGRVMISTLIMSDKLDISVLPKGMYILTIKSNTSVFSKKILKM